VAATVQFWTFAQEVFPLALCVTNGIQR
jgi:hypothetical protein